uniref:Conotoxin Im6.9 n=2 Tax=Conus TaxID=6490 RepID=O269_CONIM|nr:RecName: Full=Conotoxin Im6.9; AltName: Full=Conopeptide im019; Flags: Precursor [Conus imperialis]AME17677.1 conopeptide im019 [Conus imperialis]QFQ61082.1 conotoxin superfamily O2 [Conus magus]
MEKLTILLLVTAVLMSTQALMQSGIEKRQRAKIKFFSKRKTTAERWWEGECYDWLRQCSSPAQCCSGNCGAHCKAW